MNGDSEIVYVIEMTSSQLQISQFQISLWSNTIWEFFLFLCEVKSIGFAFNQIQINNSKEKTQNCKYMNQQKNIK